MKTILIILGILVCINLLIVTISKAFAEDTHIELLKSESSISIIR